MPGLEGGLLAGLAIPVAAAIYFILVWGQRSTGECSWRDDDQVGLKIIVATLLLVGTTLFASGLQGLLHLLLTFSEFVARLKGTLPDLLVGVVVVGGTIMFAVPKTNHEQHPKALRLTAGAIALFGAVGTVVGFNTFLKTLFLWPDWSSVAGALTSLVASVVVFGASGYLYAKMIGVEVPDIQMPDAQQLRGHAAQAAQAAQAAHAAHVQPAYQQQQQQQQQHQQQQQQAYQQPQQGYPPQQQQQQPQQGYPPQQGGGGYPPPGGGGYGQ